MNKFTSIEQFRNVRRKVEWKAQYQGDDVAGEPILNRDSILPTIKFIGTVKCHGSNAGVQINNGIFTCQSRERIITIGDDNYGFANRVSTLSDSAKQILQDLVNNNGILYFEWCGKGIQNKVAICELPKMAILIGAKDCDNNWLDIAEWKMPEDESFYNIFQFPTFELYIDFERPAEAVSQLNQITLDVEKECPVGKYFGVSLIGEGVVWSPEDKSYDYNNFAFKVKGEAHSGSKVKKLADVDVEKVKSIEEFVEKTVTEERLMQGWNHLHENKLFDYEKSTGIFLSWIFNDIMKEEGDTLEASGLGRKDFSGIAAKKSRNWYLQKVNLL